jgi:predicted DNA-binding transcriptional regulator YafY
MKRAERLFLIVELLRSRRLVTAEFLAGKLGVSKRTVYRDIAGLVLTGVPVLGEAGSGYVLRRKMDLPPLMFDSDELTAIELGLSFVRACTEPRLTRAADSARAKVKNALPGTVAETAVISPMFISRRERHRGSRLACVRAAMDSKYKIRIDYKDAAGASTRRVVWPLGMFFFDAWTLVCWCESRSEFRSFRLDRIQGMDTLGVPYPEISGRRLVDYFEFMQSAYAVMPAELGVND